MKAFARASWAVCWRLALLFTVWALLLAPLLVPGQRWLAAHGLSNAPAATLALEVLSFTTLVLACAVALRVGDARPLSSLGLASPRIGPAVAGGALGTAMMLAVVATIWALGYARWVPAPAIPVAALLLTTAATTINAATQELLIQGYLLQRLRLHGSVRWALPLTVVLFVTMHGPAAFGNPLAALNLLLAGLLLGTAFLRTGSLWLSIGIHAGWNVVEGPALGLNVSGHELGAWHLLEIAGPAWLTGGAFGPEGGAVGAVVTLTGLLLMLAVVGHPRDACS